MGKRKYDKSDENDNADSESEIEKKNKKKVKSKSEEQDKENGDVEGSKTNGSLDNHEENQCMCVFKSYFLIIWFILYTNYFFSAQFKSGSRDYFK